MITFKAAKDNSPFYKVDDEMQKEDWLKKLNLTEEQFSELTSCGGDLIECDSQLELLVFSRSSLGSYSIGSHDIAFYRKGIPLTEEDAHKIVGNITKAFPDLNDLLK